MNPSPIQRLRRAWKSGAFEDMFPRHFTPEEIRAEYEAATASILGAGNSAKRPEAVEVETSEPQAMLLPSDLFNSSQSDRMRAAADRHFSSVEGGAR